MRSFFSKIFTAFIVTMLTATLLCGGVFYYLQKANIEDIQQKGEEGFLHRVAQVNLYSAQAAFTLYQTYGRDVYGKYLDHLEDITGTELHIVLGNGDRSLREIRLPEDYLLLMKKAKASGEYELYQEGLLLYMAKLFVSPEAEPYVVVGRLELPKGPPLPPPPLTGVGDHPPFSNMHHPGAGPPPNIPPVDESLSFIENMKSIQNFWWGWVSLLVLVGGLGCYFFARYLSDSLKRLRGVSYKLAEGDFTARTGLDIESYTGNEIQDLAYDFDQMAARLEKQSSRQQDLLRDISHELRSPLARIQVALELVRKGRMDSLSTIEKNTERLDTLIGELLASSRRRESQEMLQERVVLGELLLEIVEDASFEGQGLGKDAVITFSESLAIRGNTEVIRRGLENVIRNGLNFTPPGTHLDVSLRRNEAMACITVKDLGPGVPEQDLDDIFLPFYRVERKNNSQQGSGVGLAIAKQAVDFHGGRIVASNRDTGLEVKIYLPLF